VAQQIVLRRLGLRDPELYEYRVASDDRRTLYLAMDRPSQIQRSFARMVSEDDRTTLKEQLAVWSGPLPVSVLAKPSALADWISDKFGSDVGTVIVDSYKDLAPGLADDAVGAALNSAMQEVLARGMEWLGLHHQRKSANGSNKRPESLDDVYGSVWLTAGTGSVLGLFGQPGAATVEGLHLKQPAAYVGPLTIAHDHLAGSSATLDLDGELLALLDASPDGVDVGEVAARFFGGRDRNSTRRAQRALERVGAQLGSVEETGGSRGGAGGGGSSRRIRVRRS
jgi:hypothetical protein